MRPRVLGTVLVVALVVPGAAMAQTPSAPPVTAPSSSASPSAVPSPAAPFVSDVPGLAPPPEPTGPVWTRTLTSRKDGRLDSVITWTGGLVATGTVLVDGADRTITWASSDGLTWTRAPKAFPRGAMRWTPISVVPFRDRLFAIGSDGKRLAVWSSADGLRWTRQADQPAFASGGVDFDAPLDVTGAAATADRILVTGAYQFDWDHATRTWWSTDGATWHRVRVADPALQYLDRPVADGDGFLAVACCDRSGAATEMQLVRSTDAIAWTVVGPVPWKAYGPLAVRPDGTLFISGFPGDDSDTPAASVWTSRDGRAWSLLATGPEGISGESALAVDGRTVLLAGDGYQTEVTGWDWTLGATDRGPWRLSAGWPGMAPGCIDALALLPERAIAVGGCKGAQAWAMERTD